MFARSVTLARPLPSARITSPDGFAAGTILHTIMGPRPVERLMAGDLLLDITGQIVEIRAIRARYTQARQLVQLDHDALGREGSAGGLVVGAGQKLGLQDWRSEVLFGKPCLTPAARLTDGLRVKTPQCGARLYQLGFDAAVILAANGVAALVGRPAW